tara:strand:+ start:758 stop:976 length:219 start_codon:yes stop_codon:yes gene_type:complete
LSKEAVTTTGSDTVVEARVIGIVVAVVAFLSGPPEAIATGFEAAGKGAAITAERVAIIAFFEASLTGVDIGA